MEPISIWSECGTTPAALSSNERVSHRHQRYPGVQPRTIASCGRCEVAGYDAGSLTVCQRFDTGRDRKTNFALKREGKRRRDLQRWFDQDLPARLARILAFDARVASCWAHPEPPRNGILREGEQIMASLDWSQCPAVESIPGKVSGAWVFRGTRVPVAAIFENLKTSLGGGS